RVFAMARSDGALWLRDAQFRFAALPDGGALREPDIPPRYRRIISALTADRRGRLWLGTVRGDVGVRAPGGAFTAHASGVGRVAVIYEDRAGRFWIGGDDGVALLH